MKKLTFLFMLLFLVLPSQGLSNQTMETSTCEEDKIVLSEKPEVCPCCGASPVAINLYGLPHVSDELRKEIDEGRVYLAGCIVRDPHGPVDWICTACKQIFYKE